MMLIFSTLFHRLGRGTFSYYKAFMATRTKLTRTSCPSTELVRTSKARAGSGFVMARSSEGLANIPLLYHNFIYVDVAERHWVRKKKKNWEGYEVKV